MGPSPISLYIHVPFCTKKCPYCHFFVIPHTSAHERRYLLALEKEMDLICPFLENRELISLYFGGGTPSLLDPSTLASIIAKYSTAKEITLEINPERITLEKLRAFKEAGINRASFGVQSFDKDLLKVLGREHSAKDAICAVEMCQQAGIDNISIDLMYDLPHQTLDSWKYSLDQAIKLPITHLSLYNLTIEPHTSYFKNEARLRPYQPSEEDSAAMYLLAQEVFSSNGFEQYEISAFARDGRISLHNTGYWQARDFIGLGPSAFSDYQKERWRNVAHLERYCKALFSGQSPIDMREKLSLERRFREELVIALRLLKGVDIQLDDLLAKSVAKLEAQKLLTYQNSHLQLTARGVLFYDEVAAELI